MVLSVSKSLSLCILVFAVIALHPPATSADLVSEEIAHLMTFVERSDCQFYRNGRWHESKEAAKHIGKKYSYVKKRGMVKSAEDFIEYAATRSSMSGKAYLVQCPGEEPLECNKWLTSELKDYRGQN